MFRNRNHANAELVNTPTELTNQSRTSPSVATKRALPHSPWKVRVVSLSSQHEAIELEVQAENWLAALRETRAQLGDAGGVPPGASCVMSATGEVTILDAGNRRRYELVREGTEASQGDSAQPSAAGLDLAAAHAAAAAAVRSARAKQRLALSEPAALAKRESTAPLPSDAKKTDPGPVARASSLPPPSRPSLPPPSAAAASAARAAHRPSLRAVSGGAPGRTSSLPGAPRTELVSAGRPDANEEEASLPVDGLLPIYARDLEPSPELPLVYRERAFLLAGAADAVRLEVLLQAELACLRRELAGRPRGQFVRLSAFDHAFDEAPERLPLATLEWRDWRGAAVFTRSSALAETKRPSLRPSVIPAAEIVPPPPAAPVAPASAPPPAQSVPETENNERTALPAPAPAPVEPLAAASDQRPEQPSLAPAAEQPEPPPETDQRLASAFEAMPDLYFLPTPLSGLEFTVQLLADLVPCEAITSCLYDINTDEFRLVALSGTGSSERQASAVPSGRGLFGVAKRAPRELLVVHDVTRATAFDAAIDGRPGLSVHALVYAPLRHGGQLLGMLQLLNPAAPFSEADAAVLVYAATQLAEFIASRRAL